MKTYIKITVLSVFLLLLQSCDKQRDDCDRDCFGFYIDENLVLKVQDMEGNNLLNNKYFTDSIKLYYIYTDGCKIYYYNIASDVKKGFIMYNDVIDIGLIPISYHEHNGKFYSTSNDTCQMFIEWNSQDTDTIVTTFVHLKGTKENPLPSGYCRWDLYDKIYYNGKLIVSSWEDNQEKMSQGIYPTIIKE